MPWVERVTCNESMNSFCGHRAGWLGALALTMLVWPVSAVLAQTGAIDSPTIDPSLARDREPTKRLKYSLGLGVGVASDYHGGDDYQGVPIPVFRAQSGHRFGQLVGLHGTSNLLDSPSWQLGPAFNFRRGYSDVDNNRVDDLKNRGGSFELGLKGAYVTPVGSDAGLIWALEVLADVSGGHDGWVFTPSVKYRAPINDRWSYMLGANTSYASGSFMSHYFSVNRSESLGSGLDEFDADADFMDFGIDGLLGYQWTERWTLFLVAKYSRMLGDAKDSPVVDDEGDENQFFGAVAFTYTW